MLINPLNAIITSNSQPSSKRQKNHDSIKLQHFAFNAFESLRSEQLDPIALLQDEVKLIQQTLMLKKTSNATHYLETFIEANSCFNGHIHFEYIMKEKKNHIYSSNQEFLNSKIVFAAIQRHSVLYLYLMISIRFNVHYARRRSNESI